MLEATLTDIFIVLTILFLLIPLKKTLNIYRLSKLNEYIIFAAIFFSLQVNFGIFLISLRFSNTLINKLEFFSLIFVYFFIFLLVYQIQEIGSKENKTPKLLSGLIGVYTLGLMLLVIRYNYWFAGNNLTINFVFEIYRILSGVVATYTYLVMKPLKSTKNIVKIRRLMISAGILIILVGISDLVFIFLLFRSYSIDLVNLSLIILSGLALLAILILSFVSIKYPETFIITHAQIGRAMDLYQKIHTMELAEKKVMGIPSLLNYLEELEREGLVST